MSQVDISPLIYLRLPPAHAASMSDAIASAGMVVYVPDSVSGMSSVTMAEWHDEPSVLSAIVEREAEASTKGGECRAGSRRSSYNVPEAEEKMKDDSPGPF